MDDGDKIKINDLKQPWRQRETGSCAMLVWMN